MGCLYSSHLRSWYLFLFTQVRITLPFLSSPLCPNFHVSLTPSHPLSHSLTQTQKNDLGFNTYNATFFLPAISPSHSPSSCCSPLEDHVLPVLLNVSS